MISFIRKSLTLKILIMLISILILSFAGLSLFTVKVQTSLLEDMIQTVDFRLTNTGIETQKQFTTLESDLTDSLESMKLQVVSNISESTQKAISKEEELLKKGMDEILNSNAKILADLLHTIAQPILMEEKYDEVKKFAATVTESNEVIYALFFDADGNSLVNYVDYVDDRIDRYLQQGHGENDVEIVLAESKQDPTVLVYEKKLQYFGIPKGSIIICVARDAVDNEIRLLESRFELYKKSNTDIIQSVINSLSGKAVSSIKAELKSVNQNNVLAIKDTADLLKSSVRTVNENITRLIVVVGAFCCLLILITTVLIFRFMILNPIKELLNMMASYSNEYAKEIHIPINVPAISSLDNGLEFILTKKSMGVLDNKDV
ncbi:MAG: hypothetical protein HQK69_09330 [Desulfamplus sp.]|nr:hypothetical protein [Desulfamplus sp.]